VNGPPILALVLAVVTAAMAASVPIYFGSRKPGYSHVRHTISELGEIGSPVGRSVSYIGFLSTGISLWLFLLVAARALPHESTEALFLLSLVGAGYVGGAIFRCDPGAPLIGSWRNTLHNVFGGLEYLGAAGAFTTLKNTAFWSPLSELMVYAGGLVFVCLWGISFPHPFRGLVQRVAETTIFLGVVLVGWWVYRVSA
jgi:hypothetical protein